MEIGKDAINDDPEDDKGNTPDQKNQLSPENKQSVRARFQFSKIEW